MFIPGRSIFILGKRCGSYFLQDKNAAAVSFAWGISVLLPRVILSVLTRKYVNQLLISQFHICSFIQIQQQKFI